MESTNTENIPSSYSTKPKGLKALYLLLHEGKNLRVVRYSGSFDSIPTKARVLFVTDPASIDHSDIKALVKWVKKGNTLILSISSPEIIAGELGVCPDISKHKRRDTLVRPEHTKYSTGVKFLQLDEQLLLCEESGTIPLIKDQSAILAAERSIGHGRVIVLGDPALISNSGLRKADNVVFATNLVYANTSDHDLVVFLEPDNAGATGDKRPPEVLDLGGKLSFSLLGLVILMVLISAGTRFGEIHPLIDKSEKKRAWELVGAMAGLYMRAEAREAALVFVFRAFMRELVTRYGVPPSASPEEAAETVLRARDVDRARLLSLIQRCKDIECGRKADDLEVLKLAKSIEQLRRELGIAR